MKLPSMSEISRSEELTQSFPGLDRNLRGADGSMSDMRNLTSDHYPLLAARERRTMLDVLVKPNGLLAKDKLVWVDNRNLFYGGVDLTDHLTDAGVHLTDSEKTLVSMGAYIIILPDKAYMNTQDYTDCGKIEADWVNGSPATVSLCMEDGAAYDYTAGKEAPASPKNGQFWLDTSGETDAMKVWNESSGSWVSVETVYCRISCTGIGAQFQDNDGVTVSGVEQIEGSRIVQHVTQDSMVLIGLVPQTVTVEAGKLHITRKMPEMDYVVECQNRLWGCFYGVKDGQTINEIYCCALGDFKNWERYAGISTDSYRASVGTDGKWTGAITYLGYPLFWKENHLHKVYVDEGGAHQIQDTACRGVQEGCGRSLQVVNDRLYFKSRSGVCAYDGSLPENTGYSLGNELFSEAVGGSLRGKYYLSMRGETGWSLFVYDTKNGIWVKEDNTHALAMATLRDELYILDAETKQFFGASGRAEGEKEKTVQWSATTNIVGYSDAGQKYVSRFAVRLRLEDGATAQFSIEYDSNGIWLPCGSIVGNRIKSAILPVKPRRCDHFRIRITGFGTMQIYSISKIYEKGSDVCGY